MALTYETAHTALASRLSEPALEHSERVAETAAALARRYGLDVGEARLGGLLHDWHRETSAGELLETARAAGIEITDVDEAVPYLLHGPVARVDLAREFPDLSAAVLDAVGTHTYGGEGLSPLAMVVYIADVIEPGRDHKGVRRLREAVDTSALPVLFAQVYAASLRHLIKRRRRIHPATLRTWNRIVADGDS